LRGLGSDFDLREDVIVILLLILITLLLLYKDLDCQLRLLLDDQVGVLLTRERLLEIELHLVDTNLA
jgi:hypothetical protein